MAVNKKIVLQVLILLVSVFVLYGQYLENPIIFDDLPFFYGNGFDMQPVSIYQFDWLQIRSFPYATFAWTKALSELNIVQMRLGNIVIHAATVCVLYLFLKELIKYSHKAEGVIYKNSNWFAFYASLIFAVHPVATYAVGYLIQRTILMATLFSLLALLTYLRGSVGNKSILMWLCVPFYYLAVFSKEHAIMLPAVIAALTIAMHDDWLTRLRQRRWIFTSMLVVAGTVVLAKRGVIGSVYEPNGAVMLGADQVAMAYPMSVITQAGMFFKYIFLWLLPNPAWMSIDMREPFADGFLSIYGLAAAGFIFWGILGGWLLFKRDRKALAGFGMIFPWLMFMTEFSVVRIQDIFVLYRSYIWVIGGFCVFPALIEGVDIRKLIIFGSSIVFFLFGFSMERLVTMSHPLLVWDDAEKLIQNHTHLSGAYRIYNNRGTELLKIDQTDRAIADFNLAMKLSGEYAEARGNIGMAYLKKQEWEKSSTSFSRAIKIRQMSGKAVDPYYYFGRAHAYEGWGHLPDAKADYEVSCRLARLGCEKLPSD